MSKPQRLPSGNWRIQWRDHTGKRRSETYSSHSAAKAALRRHTVEVDDIRSRRVRPVSNETLLDASKRWLETRPAKRRKHNESHLRNHVWPELGGVRLGELTEEHIARLTRTLEVKPRRRPGEKNVDETPLSRNTIANVLRTLSKFLNDMKVRLDIEIETAESDYRWIKTGAEVSAFLDSCRPEWFRIAAALAVYAGLRAGEVAGLRPAAVDFDNETITVSETYCGEPTKSKHVRVVPLAPGLADILKPWLRFRRGEWVVMREGRALEPKDALNGYARRACRRAGIDEVTFHDLRHTCASHLAKRIPLPMVGAILGHADPKTTARYAHHDALALAKDPRTRLSFADAHVAHTGDEEAQVS